MKGATFDLIGHLERQRAFSERTFGPGMRTAGVVDHIRKELIEIEAKPADLEEWVDVILLAFDGAWRCGAEPVDITLAIVGKQMRNELRTWPDWRTAPEGKAIEHVRAEAPTEAGDYYTHKICAGRTGGMRESANVKETSEAPPLSDVLATVDSIDGWIGWEQWARDPTEITLDGTFTIAQLESLVTVLQHKLHSSPPTWLGNS